MKKCLCAFIAGLMLCLLAGCKTEEVEYVKPTGGNEQQTASTEPTENPTDFETPTTPNDMDSHVGTWHATIDMGSWLKERFHNSKLLPFLSDDEIPAELYLELTEDGTYRRYLAPGTSEALFEQLKYTIKTATYSYLNDYLTQNGFDTSPENYLSNNGYSLDSYVVQYVIGEDFEQKVMDLLEKSCHYRIVNGKLYEWNDGERSTAYYETFTLTTLTLTFEGNNAEEDLLGLYPLQYSREATG